MSDDPIPGVAPDPSPARRALRLTDAIYAAAVSPPLWSRFLEAFSNELGGAAIAMSLQLPGAMAQPEYYRTRLNVAYVPVFEKHFGLGLPWPMTDPLFREGFRRANELFPDERLSATGYYREYMQPQGIAPEGPLAHMIVSDAARPISGISIQRLDGHRHFDDDDLAMCNLVAPHLARAHAIRRQLKASRHEQGVRTEVLDRVATGIVLVDEKRLAVAANRSAERILGQRDGFQLDGGLLRATGRANQAALDSHLDRTTTAEGSDETASGFVTIERPSGQRPYSVIISPLLDARTDSQVGDRVAAVFITDPETNAHRHTASINSFRQMYRLTPAQTELSSLLAEGRSLQEISNDRGVSINTTRSQLKQIFGKTGTRRQSELVQLALTGIAAVRKD